MHWTIANNYRFALHTTTLSLSEMAIPIIPCKTSKCGCEGHGWSAAHYQPMPTMLLLCDRSGMASCASPPQGSPYVCPNGVCRIRKAILVPFLRDWSGSSPEGIWDLQASRGVRVCVCGCGISSLSMLLDRPALAYRKQGWLRL